MGNAGNHRFEPHVSEYAATRSQESTVAPTTIAGKLGYGYSEVREPRLLYGEEAKLVLREALLSIYIPKNMYDVVKPPTNAYYRVYKRGDEYAVFLLFEWGEQIIPPHKHDYEPVIVFLDRDLNVKEVYVDGFHYYVQRYRAPPLADTKPHIRIQTPWRAMEVSWSEPPKDFIMVYPVDETRGTWSATRLRYLSDKVINELRSREVNPLSVHPRLIKNPWVVREARHWSTIREPTTSDLLNDFAKNYRVSRVDLFLEKARLFIRSLVESAKLILSGLARRLRDAISAEKDEFELTVS